MKLEDLKLDIRCMDSGFQKQFEGKDFISMNDLLDKFDDLLEQIEDLEHELYYTKDALENLEQDVEDNYKPIKPDMDFYGISINDFI